MQEHTAVRRTLGSTIIALSLLASVPSHADDRLIAAKWLRIRAAPEASLSRAQFRAFPAQVIQADVDPSTVETSFRLTALDCSSDPCVPTEGTGEIVLDPALWRGRGTPAGSKGYRYLDPRSSRGGIRSIRYQNQHLSIRVRGTLWPWSPSGSLDTVVAEFRVGPDRYCAVLGGETKRNEPELFWRTNAAAPDACPIATCGNGVLEEGETCDGSDSEACEGLCTPNCECPTPVCGNGVVEAGEACEGAAANGGCGLGANAGCGTDCQCCVENTGCASTPCCDPLEACSINIFDPQGTCRPLGDVGDTCSPDAPINGVGCLDGLECVDPPGQLIFPRCLDIGGDLCLMPPDFTACEDPDQICHSIVVDDRLISACGNETCTETSDCLSREECIGGTCCGQENAVCTPSNPSARTCCASGLECRAGPAGEDTCQPIPVCGNDLLELGEVCDGTDSQACLGLCQPDCTCPAPVCGNGVVESGEQCDGSGVTTGCEGCTADCSCCTAALGCFFAPCCDPNDVCIVGGPGLGQYGLCQPQNPPRQLGEQCILVFEQIIGVQPALCEPQLDCLFGAADDFAVSIGAVQGVCSDLRDCNPLAEPSSCGAGESCIIGNFYAPSFLESFCAVDDCVTDEDCPLANETCENGTCCSGGGQLCQLGEDPTAPFRACCSAGLECQGDPPFRRCLPTAP